MGFLKKYYPSICLLILSIALSSCLKLSNERYDHLSIDERRALSAEYTQLAKRLETGSPKNMEILDKAVRINPRNDLAWRELSLPYLYAGLFEEWNNHITKAIELNPEAWQAWRGYDRLYYFRDYAGALFDLDASDTLTRDQVDYPQNRSVDYLRGLCYFGLNDYSKSIEYFNKYIEDEALKLGDAYIDESVFLYLGLIYEKQGDYLEAIRMFDRGLKYEDSYADFNYHKARLHCYMDNLAIAKKEFNKAREKYEDGNRMRAYRYEAIGELYLSDYDKLYEQLFADETMPNS